MQDIIKNNTIIISSNESKIQILKNLKQLVNIKFFTINEFIKNLYFDYDEKSILYVIKKYNLKYDVAKEYLDNLIYIENKKYNNKKLDFLVNLKNELIENKLLIFNNRFKKYIKEKDIIIYNYDLSKFEKYLLSNIDYKIINKENNNYIPKIFEAQTIEEEVEFVAYSISKLIDSGIDISKIKLTNISEDYINIIEKIFSFYNLKINKHKNIPIISTIIGNKFFNSLDLGIEKSLENIKEYNNTISYKKIVDICNKYIWCTDINDLKTLIFNDLNNTYIEHIKYTNEIEVIDYKNYIVDDEYVFMLGFNQGIIPILKKDEDYINDSIKPSYLDNTVDLNKKEKEQTLRSIKNIKNLIITYKLKTDFNTFYPSSLIEELDSEVNKINIDLKVSYSDLSNILTLSKLLDNLIKYGEKSDKLSILNSNYEVKYNTYTSSFTGLNKEKLNTYIKSLKTFNLSFSTMDDYNRCAFRFYIEKILNLKTNINKFSVLLGNIYHHILELSTNNTINVEEEVYKYLSVNEIILKSDEEFFIKRTIDNINYLINTIKAQNKYSKLNIIETEKNICVPLIDNINFIGFIDKIMYKKDKEDVIATIIDYKTYIKKPSLKYKEYGIGLQLPVYMFLASSIFNNIKFAGFYMQNIMLDNMSEEEKQKSLKLIGYSNKNKEILEQFDYNYMDSKVINGIKVNNDGSFSSNSLKNMLSDDEINDLINLTSSKIKETLKNILDSKFDINPKFDKTNIGCEFCNFKDLCFMNESSYVKITAHDDI